MCHKEKQNSATFASKKLYISTLMIKNIKKLRITAVTLVNTEVLHIVYVTWDIVYLNNFFLQWIELWISFYFKTASNRNGMNI